MIAELVLWVLLMLFVALLPQKNMKGVGLPMAYLCAMSINHWFGAFIYQLPWYEGQNYDFVRLGFQQSFYGVVSFVFASKIVAPALFGGLRQTWFRGIELIPSQRLPVVHILTGAVFYFLLWPFLEGIASIRTVAYSGWWLMIGGLCLACWKVWWYHRGHGLLRWLLLALVFPMLTTMGKGFLGYGVAALMVVLTFVSSFYRPKWKMFLAAALSIYLGLSFFVTYLRDRNELRQIIWEDREATSARFQFMGRMINDFEFLDLHNDDHLWRINGRMNQNYLVGKAVDYMASGNVEFAEGSTLREAAIAMVPRILWPSKPVVAGSGDLVGQYTGLVFSEGTSVGIGHVMELYINFGTPCVLAGFFILGILLTLFDVAAGNHLAKGSWPGAVFWLLSGMGFLHVIGSFVEMTSTVVCSLVFCFFINKYVLPQFAGHRPIGKLLTTISRFRLRKRRRGF